MASRSGLSISELQSRALGRSSDLYDVIRMYEGTLLNSLAQENIEDINKWSWDLGTLSMDRRESLSDYLFDVLGIDKPDLLDAMGREGSAFNVVRPSETFTHGFGSLVMGDEARLTSRDDIFARLFYTTSNIQIRGTQDPLFMMRPRYKADYLMQQAEAIEEMKSGDFFGNRKMFVLDTETAGFSMKSGIWQIAGRTTENLSGEVRVSSLDPKDGEFAADAVVDNVNMKKGMTLNSQGQAVPLTELFAGIQSEGKVDSNIIDAIDRMGDEILDSHYIMGQNLSFDMPRITHDIQKALDAGGFDESVKKRMGSIVSHLENNVKYVDTQVLSQYIFQDAGDNAIQVAKNLMDKNQFTRFSIENVMLQTNFLDLLAEDLGDEGWGIIEGMLSGEGAHNAKVDTFITAHLGRIQAEHIGGRGRKLVAKEMDRKNLRESIARSAAWTPYTADEAIGGMRPVEYMVEHMRQMNRNVGKLNKGEVFYNAGMLSDWAESMMDEEGFLKDPNMLYDSDFTKSSTRFGKSIRDRAFAEGLEIGKYSPLEALFTTKIAEIGGAGMKDVKAIAGDVIGAGRLSATQGIDFVSKTSTRNIGMSMDFLRWGEEAGLIPEGTVTGDFISARWSTVRGQRTQGLALVVDPFGTGDKGRDQLAEFKKRFQETFSQMSDEDFANRFGIGTSRRSALDVVSRMTEDVLDYGVQIGFMESDQRGQMGRLLNLFESENLGVDNTDAMQLRTHAYLLGDDTKTLHTGVSYLDTRNTVPEMILESQRRFKDLNQIATSELSRDPVKRTAIMFGRSRDKDFVKSAVDFVKSPTAKKGGIAALAGAFGYYLYGRKKEQAPYDEVMEFSGFESGVPNGRTPYEMGSQTYGSVQPLETAGLIKELDYNKIRHDNMSPDKYSHLF